MYVNSTVVLKNCCRMQISLWEEKVDQVKSTKDAVAGAKGQEDLIMLRSQVHRMQLRCAQLSKQQEIMLKVDFSKLIFVLNTVFFLQVSFLF